MLLQARPLIVAFTFAFAPSSFAHTTSSEVSPHDAVTRLDAVTIQAYPLVRSGESMAVPAEAIDGSLLVLHREATLGTTLESMTGVRADTFGGGASRPVIRGQTAPRVKVLSDGSELMDASGVSPDHAITIEPMLARRIEVLRGPSALLYGGGAVGGVVNVLDDKIPESLPENGLEGFAEMRGVTGSQERAGAFGITAGEGNIAMHIEGAKRRSDDYRVPRWADSRLKGSDNESSTGSVGLSWIGSRGFAGLAFTKTRSQYGLPGHSHEYEGCHPHGSHLHCGGHDHEDEHEHEHEHQHEHAHDHATPYVRLNAQRIDLRGEYREPFSGIQKIRLRGGLSGYRHDEIDDGEVATTFKNRGEDMRVELEHKPFAGWRGIVGLQGARSTFSALGEESFLPRAVTRNLGIFLHEEYKLAAGRLELGARQDWQSVKSGSYSSPSSLRGTSLSAATVWDFAPQYAISMSLARSQRLPNAQELYANGIHLATNTYEVGNANLTAETSHNVDLTLRKHAGDARFSVGVFHNYIKNYIYANTLDRYNDFRLIEYAQHDARFTGIEGEASYRFSSHLTAGVFGDLVHGKLLSHGGNLPRIPSARAGLKAKTSWGSWSGNLEAYRIFRQNRVADFESMTPGYNMVNLGVSYDGKLGAADYTVYLRATNLFDVRAFNHASFLANTAPLPGRRVMLGVRMEY